MRIWFVVLLLWCPPVLSQQIYKCGQAQGGHAYQSQPCETGDALQVWDGEALANHAGGTAHAANTPARTRPAAGPQQTRRRVAPTAAQTRQRTAAKSRSPDRHARCEAARSRRHAELKRLGLKRTFDQLRALNDPVSAACNHR